MQPIAPALTAGLPFAGLLLSMAVFPIVAPRFWQRRMGLVALAWCVMLLAQQALTEGAHATALAAWHALLLDYVPFITMLLALYTTGGGILVRGGLAGTPKGNTAMLAVGVVAGSVAGTTAAAMVLIQPLLHANAHRSRKTHLVLFLIVLVANASITPLGNPPLYIGLLHGVPFFWPIRQLIVPLMVVALLLLTIFYFIDQHLAAREPPAPEPARLHIRGWWNVGLVLVVVITVMLQGKVQLGHVALLGLPVPVSQFIGVVILLLVTLLSARLTPRAIRQANDFTWHPRAEVAMLFAGIFITIGPVIEMLQAGMNGPLAPLLRLTLDAAGQPRPLAYFWLTGTLSAFLDNAPTYLVFFELAGLRPESLSDADSLVLQAISAGAVFFGGLTYIGNAPNLILRGIAAHRGVRMPGFFGFMLLSSVVLLPIFGLLSIICFW
jgi:Na+/H+ antiporter NhaD/arsenite permease-like protein